MCGGVTICALALLWVFCPDCVFTLSITSAHCKSYETKKEASNVACSRQRCSFYVGTGVLERLTLVFVIKTAFANSSLA